MAEEPVMFNVTVDGADVAIRKLGPGKRGYDKARKRVIYRERDAIALFNQRLNEGISLDGVYSFQSLDNARTFALLHLKTLERRIGNNLDHIWSYDGSRVASG